MIMLIMLTSYLLDFTEYMMIMLTSQKATRLFIVEDDNDDNANQQSTELKELMIMMIMPIS